MPESSQHDEQVARELLEALREAEPDAPSDLPAQTLRTVRSMLTARELIDMATVVFLLRFCAPLLDLVVALLENPDPERDRYD